jgi:hypothetical protein
MGPQGGEAIFVKSNFLLKIGMPAIVAFMRDPDRDLPSLDKSDVARDVPGWRSPQFWERSARKITPLNARNPLKSHDSEQRILEKERKKDTESRKRKER